MHGGVASSSPATASDREKLVVAIAFGVVTGYAALLATSLLDHIWITDSQGRPVVEDFVAFWSAGRLVLHGTPLAPYDAPLQHAAEAATMGHPFETPLGWSYPPVFLFVASLLARLPYGLAYLLWCATTLALYATAVAIITRRRAAFLVACAAPWALLCAMPGQNGLLTAALFGFALARLEHRQISAGIFFGLLAYKPQFGILVPFALAAGGYWRAFVSAAAVALLSNALAAAVFGAGTVVAFLEAIRMAAESHLADAGVGANKLQSLYGLARAAGFSASAASFAQLAATLAAIVGVAAVWRRPVPFTLKAALLAATAPLATPYVFAYDQPILTVALAFLYRQRGFDRLEIVLLALSVLATFGFLWLPVPTALLASVAVASIAARRCHGSLSRTGAVWSADLRGTY